jgi:hypothetical protein
LVWTVQTAIHNRFQIQRKMWSAPWRCFRGSGSLGTSLRSSHLI